MIDRHGDDYRDADREKGQRREELRRAKRGDSFMSVSALHLPWENAGIRPRLWSDALNLTSLLVLAWFALLIGEWGRGLDAKTFYAVDPANPYINPVLYSAGGFHYAPAAAQALWVAQSLPWPVFHTAFVGMELGALAILVGPPLAVLLVAVQAPLIWTDVEWANINLAVAVLVALGLRRPYLWAPVLLTKVTPGIGLVWFIVRRDWSSLAIAAGVTTAIAGISFALGGLNVWLDWYRLVLRGNDSVADQYSAIPVLLRVALGVGIVAWGAITDRAWAVPLAAAVSVPILDPGFVLVLGIVRLTRNGGPVAAVS
jgi:hypothetical protein